MTKINLGKKTFTDVPNQKICYASHGDVFSLLKTRHHYDPHHSRGNMFTWKCRQEFFRRSKSHDPRPKRKRRSVKRDPICQQINLESSWHRKYSETEYMYDNTLESRRRSFEHPEMGHRFNAKAISRWKWDEEPRAKSAVTPRIFNCSIPTWKNGAAICYAKVTRVLRCLIPSRFLRAHLSS